MLLETRGVFTHQVSTVLPFQCQLESYGLMDSRAEGCVDGIIVLITITTVGAAIDILTEDDLLQIFDFH